MIMPKVTVVRLFNGERRSEFEVPANYSDLCKALAECALGSGWGIKIEAPLATLETLPTIELIGGRYLVQPNAEIIECCIAEGAHV